MASKLEKQGRSSLVIGFHGTLIGTVHAKLDQMCRNCLHNKLVALRYEEMGLEESNPVFGIGFPSDLQIGSPSDLKIRSLFNECVYQVIREVGQQMVGEIKSRRDLYYDHSDGAKNVERLPPDIKQEFMNLAKKYGDEAERDIPILQRWIDTPELVFVDGLPKKKLVRKSV